MSQRFVFPLFIEPSLSLIFSVWANETSISHETNTRQRKGETDSFCNLGNKKYLNNGLSYESWEDWDVDDQQLKRKVGSGKQVRLSNPGKLRSTSQRDSSSRGGLDAPYNWFAEGFTAAGISSGLSITYLPSNIFTGLKHNHYLGDFSHESSCF